VNFQTVRGQRGEGERGDSFYFLARCAGEITWGRAAKGELEVPLIKVLGKR